MHAYEDCSCKDERCITESCICEECGSTIDLSEDDNSEDCPHCGEMHSY